MKKGTDITKIYSQIYFQFPELCKCYKMSTSRGQHCKIISLVLSIVSFHGTELRSLLTLMPALKSHRGRNLEGLQVDSLSYTNTQTGHSTSKVSVGETLDPPAEMKVYNLFSVMKQITKPDTEKEMRYRQATV